MEIIIKHFDGKYPSFNVGLASAPGKEPFVEIKGCRIFNGQKGEFVSWPATKNSEGKYWNHVYGSEAFNQAVLAEAKKGMLKPAAKPSSGFDDFDSPPF